MGYNLKNEGNVFLDIFGRIPLLFTTYWGDLHVNPPDVNFAAASWGRTSVSTHTTVHLWHSWLQTLGPAGPAVKFCHPRLRKAEARPRCSKQKWLTIVETLQTINHGRITSSPMAYVKESPGTPLNSLVVRYSISIFRYLNLLVITSQFTHHMYTITVFVLRDHFKKLNVSCNVEAFEPSIWRKTWQRTTIRRWFYFMSCQNLGGSKNHLLSSINHLRLHPPFWNGLAGW